MAEAVEMTLEPVEPEPVPINDATEPVHDPAAGYPWTCVSQAEAPPGLDLDYYQCKVCGNLPRFCFEFECGHGTCCETCKDRASCNKTADCPGVIEKVGSRYRRQLNNLVIPCLRHELGCQARIPVGEWDQHVTQDCPYQVEQCDQCNDKYRILHKDRHMNAGKHHICDLAKYEMNCPSKKMTLDEYERHREENYLQHIDVIAEGLADSKAVLTNRIDQLTDQNNFLREEIEVMRQANQDKDRELNKVKAQIEKISEKWNEFGRRILGCEYALELVDEFELPSEEVEDPRERGTSESKPVVPSS